MSVQQYCLRWNNHQPNFISVFSTLLHNEALVDVTLAAEGRQLQAHKVVLSACSSYFQSLFTSNPCQHPIVILKDVQYNDLKTIVDFMYYGEVNVSTEQLPQILKTAETLKIKGLAELPDGGTLTKSESQSIASRDQSQIGNGSESIWGSTESQQQAQQYQQQQQQQMVQVQQYHSATPPPTCMSPAARRKRYRKSSSGSGSIERHQYQQQQEHGGSVQLEGAHGNSNSQTSVHSRSFKESSSTETEPPQQESLQSQENIDAISHQPNVLKMEVDQEGGVSVPLDISGSSSISTLSMTQAHQQHSGESSPAVLTHSQSVSGTSSSTTTTMGSKRGRLLIRQPRVKKELEGQVVQSGSDPDTPDASTQLYTTCLLTVPTSRVMERHASEPAPGKITVAASSSPNLLSVPTSQSHLIKQHSHPLLPSQSSHSSSLSTYTLHRQLSHPVSSASASGPVTFVTTMPSMNVQTTHKSSIEHHKSLDSGSGIPSSHQANPLVVIIPDTSAGTTETYTSTTAAGGLLNVGGTHKLKPDEFTRSISSPLSSTTSRELLSLENTSRSSHCPVIRPGPALGCNFCWNTIDAHGRILRRKTKYHCPECQTNLCIVPCFQEYHERQNSENPPTTTEPAIKSSQRHQYAKSGSM